MIYWWGFKENYINLDVCYFEVIILRVVVFFLGIKRLFFFFGVFYFVLSNYLWNEKVKKFFFYFVFYEFRIINGKMEVKIGLLIYNLVCIVLCVVLILLKFFLNICILYIELKCLKLEKWMFVLLILCLCLKSNI